MAKSTQELGRDQAARVALVGALAVAFAGLFAAAVLSAGHLLDLPVPCGRGHGCLTVARHPSSKVAGVPIAFLGVAAYLVLIHLLGFSRRARRSGIPVLLVAGAGTIVSGILLYYARTVIHATCAWCVVSGVAMTLVFLLSVILQWRGRRLPPCRPAMVWTLALVTSCAVGIQIGFMQRAASRPPVAAEQLTGLVERDLIDPGKTLGRSDASVTIVMFGDLWCPACRAAYGSLVAFQHKNPATVRLAYRHLPLWELQGHQFSGTAAALSEIAAEKGRFWAFMNRLHQQRTQLGASGYLELMRDLDLPTADIEARLRNVEDPAVARVQRDMALADQLGIDATPAFILFVAGQQPISASPRTLPGLLNSAVVQAVLARARLPAQDGAAPPP